MRWAGPTLPVKTHPAVLFLSPHPAFVENAGVESRPRWPKDKRTTGNADRAVRVKLFDKDFFGRIVQKRFTFAAKSFFALLNSSTARCRRERRLSILCKETFDGYSENNSHADFSRNVRVYSISDSEERYSLNLTRVVEQKTLGEVSLTVTLKAKTRQTHDDMGQQN